MLKNPIDYNNSVFRIIGYNKYPILIPTGGLISKVGIEKLAEEFKVIYILDHLKKTVKFEEHLKESDDNR